MGNEFSLVTTNENKITWPTYLRTKKKEFLNRVIF